MNILIGLLPAIGFIFIGLVFISSVIEKQWRAVCVSLTLEIVYTLFWFFLYVNKYQVFAQIIIYIITALVVLFTMASLIKHFPEEDEKQYDIEQFDEREHMFSRNQLQYHPDLASKFYAAHPEFKEIDHKINNQPELGEEGGKFYDKYFAAIPEASFRLLDRSRFLATGPAENDITNLSLEKLTQTIKFIAKFYGAADIGITKIKQYHLYSHRGRHSEYWGQKVKTTHKTAVVIVTAMDQELYRYSSSLPVLMESARKYVESAKIAHIIAEYLRMFGFESRSHVDGEYEVLCVPLSRDAGLGNVGRLGLFIHKNLGPCVRLSVVTTEAELPVSVNKPDESIEHFCRICKKCSDNCPTKSIPSDEKPVSRGFPHWSVHQETCYSYWKTIGTDCGFCIKVCPYNKPNTLLHKLARFYISRNPLNQRIALFIDDFLYGRKIKLPDKNPDLFSIAKQKYS